uniref:LIM zinc-binding domain-containing protein n=1 Tax=Gasterosteus aculeatus aculeatus TaxID=481459 RepID=A0AAQ4S3C5_GASAC
PGISFFPPLCAQGASEGPHRHGEQPGVGRRASPQGLCRVRGQDRRPLPALLHGALLAHALPQVLLLPSPVGGHWHHLLQQRGHDSVSERLHQVRRRRRRGSCRFARLHRRRNLCLCVCRLFGHSGACSACGQSIPANEMVMRAQGNVYHLKCFSCATCRNRLMPGDRFHYINSTIFCEHDRPGAVLLNSHLPPLQSSSVLADQKVC